MLTIIIMNQKKKKKKKKIFYKYINQIIFINIYLFINYG